MMFLLVQAIAYLSSPAGSLVYHLVVILALAAVTGVVLLRAQAGSRLIAAAGLALLVRLALLSTDALAGMGVVSERAVMPPLDRAVSVVTIVALGWAAGFSGRLRPLDGAVALPVALAGVALAVSWLDWPGQAEAGLVFYNASPQDSYWTAAQIVAVGAGLLLVLFRRESGWAFGLAALTLLLVGYSVHRLLPVPGADYAGAGRLAEMAALPLFSLLAIRRAFERVEAAQPQTAATAAIASRDVETMPPALVDPPEPRPAPDVTLVHEPALALESAVEPVAESDVAPAEHDRLAIELSEARAAAEHLRRRAEALAEHEHARLEEIAGLRAELESVRQAQATAAEVIDELEEARREAEEQRERAARLSADLESARSDLVELEGRIETMRPQLETLDRLWVDLQVAQKQSEERAQAQPHEEELRAQLAEAQRQELKLRVDLDRARGEMDQRAAQVERYRSQLDEARQQLAANHDETARLAGKLEKARAKGERLADEVAEARTRVGAHEADFARLSEREQTRAEEAEWLSAELDKAGQRLREAEEAGARLQLDLDAAGIALAAFQETADHKQQADEALAQTTAEMARLSAELAAAAARAEAVPALESKLKSAGNEIDRLRRREAEMAAGLEIARVELAAARLRIEEQTRLLADMHLQRAYLPSKSQAETEPGQPAGNGGESRPKQPRSGDRWPAQSVEPANGSPGSETSADSAVILPVQATAHACPNLGTHDDSDTRFTFASPVHRCYALKDPAEIAAGHQSEFCLTAAHSGCPIYTGQEKAPELPINLQEDGAEPKARKRARRGGWLGGRKPSD